MSFCTTPTWAMPVGKRKPTFNALSTQATFDLPVDGETANGLRIQLGRGTFFAELANGVQVVVAVDTEPHGGDGGLCRSLPAR